MKNDTCILEQQRLELQSALDAQKTKDERNRHGQFATSPTLARDIMRYADTLLPRAQPIHFLDPAIGTGAFYSALRSVYPNRRVVESVGFEIDPHYGIPTKKLWSRTGLTVRLLDFTTQEADPRFNLVVCNPPYVRHHHLASEEKARLQIRTAQSCGVRVNGLAGLYCHFLGISHSWMAKEAIAGWLIPSEFMDVNYGAALKRYLLERVTLLHIHRFNPSEAQFTDALVSSAVIWLKNTPPPLNHTIKFTFGGSLLTPDKAHTISACALSMENKWTRVSVNGARSRSPAATLSDFFVIKRGIATGDNSFFILPEEEIVKRGLPMQVFQPILPSPRYVSQNEIEADAYGTPKLCHRLFLLNTRMSEKDIKECLPRLWSYLEEGKRQGVHERYLCKHRSIWYSQENRPPAPIVCTYLGRNDTKNGRPFRFILNHSQATVANVYLAMYPAPLLIKLIEQDKRLISKVWELLNQMSSEQLIDEGRVYGGGLYKLEPKELANVSAITIQNSIAAR